MQDTKIRNSNQENLPEDRATLESDLSAEQAGQRGNTGASPLLPLSFSYLSNLPH